MVLLYTSSEVTKELPPMQSLSLSQPSSPLGKILIWLGLIASGVLFFGALIGALWGLNPYDAVRPQLIPQSGWEYDLYNFFVLSDARSWILFTLPLLGILWFAWLYAQNRQSPVTTTALIRRFTIANVVCVVAMGVLGMIVAFLPLHLAPPPGYGYALKFIVKDGVVLAGWGLYLARLKNVAL
jgi:hypothetical protein